MRAIRVAVVDDSSFLRKAVVRILSRDPRMEVVGTAATGEALLAELDGWRPDVITLDLSMPGMGGLRTLDRIMQRRPVPVIVLSAVTREGAPVTIEALHRGAVDFIDKQRYSLVDFEALGEVLIEKIVEVAGAGARARPVPRPAETPPAAAPAVVTNYELLVIGASTGGPPAVQRVLMDLGERVPVPVVVVQHMPIGFTRAFADRLNNLLPLSVREVGDQERLLAGSVYIAPAGLHALVERDARGLLARLSALPENARHRPSVDNLFLSAASHVGARVVAILLTGMGTDGALGMSRLATAGAFTLAQDQATSAIYGMPRAAVELNAARESLPLDDIGGRARQILGSDRSDPAER